MNAVLQSPADHGPVPGRKAHCEVPPTAGGQIEIERVSIELGQGPSRFEALHKVSLQIRSGELVCLLGPSGCGKSTLLGALAGHLPASAGRLLVDGVAVGGPCAERGLVFQHHTLFPWKSVLDNVAFGLKMQGVSRVQRRKQALDLIELVGLRGFEHSYPSELSGGMQQRVEIARVLINRPRLLLMDEPFGALDALTRVKMQALLLDLWTRLQTTVLFVTHDIDEALFLGDRVVMLSPRPGRIIDEIVVPFARPRQPDLMTGAEFNGLKRHCLDVLRDPSRAGQAGRSVRDTLTAASGHDTARLSPLGLPLRTSVDAVRFAR